MSDIDSIRETISTAARMRMPRFAEDERTGQKIEALEDYILACAFMRAELVAARIRGRRMLHVLEDEWDRITGWEAVVRSSATQRDIVNAKRLLRGDLYDGIREAKCILLDLDELVRRLELDERSNSRAYTYITGNA